MARWDAILSLKPDTTRGATDGEDLADDGSALGRKMVLLVKTGKQRRHAQASSRMIEKLKPLEIQSLFQEHNL
jgi:hypothetical protein